MPYSQDFNDEFFYSPKEEELHDVAYGPRGKSRPATVGGAFGRFLRKTVADPIRGMARSVEKARSGGFSSPEEMGRAALDFAGNLVGTPSFGGGLGSGARMKAAPWQSRTLDAILGESPVGKKFPNAASPQTWVSKLKGAGLPGEEVKLADEVLGNIADPRGKLNRRQVAELLERTGLPELGVTKTELGGPKWEAVNKRINELAPKLYQAKDKLNELRGNTAVPGADKVISEYRDLLAEHSKLSQWAAGKRPGWPEHNIEELKNPREVLYHAPPKEGGEYTNHDMRLHYPGKDKNLLFHQREGILKFPDGKKSTHISEQQSDWISEFESKKKMKGLLTDEEINTNFASTLDAPLENIPTEARARFTYLAHLWETAPDSEALANNSYELRQWAQGKTDRLEPSFVRDMDMGLTQWQVRRANKSAVPEPPMKDNWWKMGLKDAVKRAVEAGHDYLTWDTPETIIKRGGEKIRGVAENHYGKNVPGFLKKEYGVEAKRVPVGKTEGRVVDLLSDRGETVNRPVEALSIYRVPAEEAPLSTLRWVVGDPDFGTYAHYGSLREAENMLNQLLEHRSKDREVLQIPITEEMQRKVFLEGQFFSKQTAKPGGRDAEMAA